MSEKVSHEDVVAHFAARANLYDKQTQWRTSSKLLGCFEDIIPKGEGSVVDLGCGTGIIGAIASDRGWQVTGVDVAPGMLNHARQRLTPLVCASVMNLPFPDHYFKGALMRQVLHYVDDLVACIEASRVVCKDGFIVIGDIVVDGSEYEWWSQMKALVQPLRRRVYTQQAHTDVLRRTGWEIDMVRTCTIRRIDPLPVFFQHVQGYPACRTEVDRLIDVALAGPNHMRLDVGAHELAYDQKWQILRGRR